MPFPRSSPHPSPPKVELLKCGESVLKTIKLVTEVQVPCCLLLLSVGALGSPIVSQIVGTLVPGVGLGTVPGGLSDSGVNA